MARPTTRAKVHDAVLSMAREGRIASATMENVAARAGISRQTLYRSWPTTGAILFDALRARSETADGNIVLPDTGDLVADMTTLVEGMASELADPVQDQLLRSVTAEIQTDGGLAAEYRDLLLRPQMTAIAERLGRGGVAEPDEIAELLVGPLLHRWLLRSRPLDTEWLGRHVRRTLRAATRES